MLVLAALATLGAGIGVLPLPFGYYSLLRIVLCLAAAVGLAAARRRDDPFWFWVYGVMAVVYNPVLPVHLNSKNLWIVVNALTLVFIWLGAIRFRGTWPREAARAR